MRPVQASRLDKAIALAAVVVLAADQQGFPTEDWWTSVNHGAPWLVPVLLVSAGLFSLSPLATHAERQLETQRTALQRQIFIYFGRLVTKAQAAIPTFDHTDLGLHTWRVRKRFPKFWHSQLVRVGTYRLGGSVQLRDFRPQQGVGVVGLCWQRNADAAVNVADLAAKYHTRAAFESALAAAPDEVMHLSWDAFEQVRHRGAVFAAPIRDGHGKFRGCVSLDYSSDFDELVKVGVPQVLNELALFLSDHDFSQM